MKRRKLEVLSLKPNTITIIYSTILGKFGNATKPKANNTVSYNDQITQKDACFQGQLKFLLYLYLFYVGV